MTSSGLACGEVAQALRRLDRVTGDEGDRRRAGSRPSNASTPASLAQRSRSGCSSRRRRWRCSPRARRSSLSWATVSPRYSVSTAAFEPRNRSVSSATAAALLRFAMGLLPVWCCGRRRGPDARRAPAQGARGSADVARPDRASTAVTCAGRPLGGTFGHPEGSATGGLWRGRSLARVPVRRPNPRRRRRAERPGRPAHRGHGASGVDVLEQVAGAVGVERDARAHRRGERRLARCSGPSTADGLSRSTSSSAAA